LSERGLVGRRERKERKEGREIIFLIPVLK